VRGRSELFLLREHSRYELLAYLSDLTFTGVNPFESNRTTSRESDKTAR